MNAILNLALMEGHAKTCQEATNASVNRDSLTSIARSVGISAGNYHVNGNGNALIQTDSQREQLIFFWNNILFIYYNSYNNVIGKSSQN